MFATIPESGEELRKLNRQLDITKSSVFLGSNSSFLGSLMCSLEFAWTREMPTAGTDAIGLWWNPDHFTGLPVETRKTVILHELWHVGRLHAIRKGSRDHQIWNYACDIVINNDLTDQGYSFAGTKPWIDTNYRGWVEEDVYDDLIKKQITPPPFPGNLDLIANNGAKQKMINAVVTAVQHAQMSGQAGTLPGAIHSTLTNFLVPVVPWEELLYKFFSDLAHTAISWARPNRRYTDIYLPSRFLDQGRLEKLNYYLDVSGSTSDADVLRFNSEVKHIKEEFKPKALDLIQFDTRIQQCRHFDEEDAFDEIEIVGRGGTDLEPVREHIIETEPTAAIVFSDMECAPMRELPFEIPIIWIAVGKGGHKPNFGDVIRIKG